MIASIRRTSMAVLLLLAPPLSAQRSQTPVDSTLGRIVFDVLETPRDTTAPPIMYIGYRTEHALSCLQPLSAKLTRGARTFRLDDWAVGTGICPTAIGPAAGGMALPLELGAQVLTIRHRGIDDRYQLDVTVERIRIRALTSPRVSVTLDSSILRFPRNSFSVTCSAQDQSWICDGLFRAVEAEPGIEAIRLPRDGRNPFQRRSSYAAWNGNAPLVPTGPATAPPRAYRYQSLRDLDRVRASMREYRDEVTGGRNGISMGGWAWTGITW